MTDRRKKSTVLRFQPKPTKPPVTRTRTPGGGLTFSVSLDEDRIAKAVLRALRDNPDGKAAAIRAIEDFLKRR